MNTTTLSTLASLRSARTLLAMFALGAASMTAGCAVDDESGDDSGVGQDASSEADESDAADENDASDDVDATGSEDGAGGGEPQAEGECTPLETRECADFPGKFEQCVVLDGPPVWNGCFEDDTSSAAAGTPIVLAFGGERVTFDSAVPASFDLAGAEMSTVTDWPAASTPWLALDRDGDGAIENGSELFGSMTKLASGGRAKNGFQALRDLDDDGDGKLTAKDAAFAKIVLWADADRDRVSSKSEMKSLADAGIQSISIDYDVVAKCDARGNCERERASFTYVTASGSVKTGAAIDVHLKFQ